MSFYEKLSEEEVSEYLKLVENRDIKPPEIESCYGCLLFMQESKMKQFFTLDMVKILSQYQKYDAKYTQDTTHISVFCRDYDFIVDGQDAWITDLNIDIKQKDENSVQVIVSFKNFATLTSIIFHFSKINDDWLISNIENNNEDFMTHFRECIDDYKNYLKANIGK